MKTMMLKKKKKKEEEKEDQEQEEQEQEEERRGGGEEKEEEEETKKCTWQLEFVYIITLTYSKSLACTMCLNNAPILIKQFPT